jgi:hypothetical protein
MVERPDYDALAQGINLEDITSCERNANILRKIRDGDQKQLIIMHRYEEEENGLYGNFFVDEGDDFGWLGYFVGRCEVIKNLQIYYLPEEGDEINEFFNGMSQNRSIKHLDINCEIGDDCWNRLGSFFENNRNLSHVDVEGFIFGHEDAQNLASALGRMHHNSLKDLSMDQCGIGDEGLAEIATTLTSQSQLTNLRLYDNNIGREGCIALGNTLSRWPNSNNLETLHIDYNVINDEGLQALVSGLMHCRSLKELDLGWNRSITADGLRSLLPLLQSEAHSLERLDLCRIDFGDDGAIALAEGLRGNSSLKELRLSPNEAGITAAGWSAFSRLLCDTSTVNSTYQSNHTLTKIGDIRNEGTPQYILDYLALNKSKLTDASICKRKILRSHPDLDMEPFFKLKMKFLPAVISWLQTSRPSRLGTESNKNSASRKLSALYKFVRGMPDLAVIGYWEGRMIHIEAEKRRLEYEEEITRERLGMSGQPMHEASRNKRMRLK